MSPTTSPATSLATSRRHEETQVNQYDTMCRPDHGSIRPRAGRQPVMKARV